MATELRITAVGMARQYKGKAAGNAFEKRMNHILVETKKEGLIESTRRGFYQLCQENRNPPRTDLKIGAHVPKQPMGRDAYRKWLASLDSQRKS